jgi:hypothetical protein
MERVVRAETEIEIGGGICQDTPVRKTVGVGLLLVEELRQWNFEASLKVEPLMSIHYGPMIISMAKSTNILGANLRRNTCSFERRLTEA